MFKLKCEYCNKVIEGYNQEHVKYLLEQHNLSKTHKEALKKAECL